MHKQLSMLHTVLVKLDENADMSRAFYECTIGKSKYILIKDALHEIEHSVCGHSDCVGIDQNIDKILTSLNARYFQNQDKYCWPSHLPHFHTSLERWINCPMTCVAEIDEFIQKIIKGD